MTEKSLTNKIIKLGHKIQALQREKSDLERERTALQNIKFQKTFKATHNIGDIFIWNYGVGRFGPTLEAREILNIYLNDFGELRIDTKVYVIGYRDHDFYSEFEIIRDCTSYSFEGSKKISKKDYELIKKMFTEPETYKTSKWGKERGKNSND